MFNSDYQLSLKIETAFEALLKSRGNLTENSQKSGAFSKWDISSTATTKGNKINTFEIKVNSQYKAASYEGGSVVIELCRVIDEKKEPAGISATQADFYVFSFVSDPNFYIIETKQLKELIEKRSQNNKHLVVDRKGYHLMIFKKDYLLQHCKKINNNIL